MVNNAILDFKRKLVTISISTMLVEMLKGHILLSTAQLDKAFSKGAKHW